MPKISELPVTTSVDGTEKLPLVQSSTTKYSLLSTLGTWIIQTLTGFIQSGTGAVARTVQAKERDIVSIKDFGAIGNGITDDTASIQAAINATQNTSNNALYFPAGTYKISSALTITGALNIIGAGVFSTTIQTTSSTADVFTFSAGASTLTGCGIRDIYISSTVPKTAGVYLNCTATTGGFSRFSAINVYTDANAFWGVSVQSMYYSKFQSVYVFGVTSNGRGFNFVGNSATAKIGDISLIDCRVISGVAGGTTRGFSFGSYTAGFYCYGLTAETTGLNYDFIIEDVANTGTSFPLDFWFTQCIGDNSTTIGWYLLAGQNLNFDNCWGTSCVNGPGVYISSPVIDTYFGNFKAYSNGTSGIVLANCTTTKIIGGTIAGNSALVSNTSYGIQVAANTTDFAISDVAFSRSGGAATHYADIYIAAGASDNYIIHDNKCNGFVTSAIVDGGTGTNAKVHDNKGYNPLATLGFPAVGASPYTYRAGHTTEVVYVIGGTVSAVSYLGQTLYSATNVNVTLPPNGQVTITYTVAPSVVSTRM